MQDWQGFRSVSLHTKKHTTLLDHENIAFKIPFFRFFYENIVAPFGAVDEKIKKENPYMEQIINNIEKKKKEKANEKFEKMFPAYAEKHKAEIEKRNSMTLKEAVNELTQILEK